MVMANSLVLWREQDKGFLVDSKGNVCGPFVFVFQ